MLTGGLGSSLKKEAIHHESSGVKSSAVFLKLHYIQTTRLTKYNFSRFMLDTLVSLVSLQAVCECVKLQGP